MGRRVFTTTITFILCLHATVAADVDGKVATQDTLMHGVAQMQLTTADGLDNNLYGVLQVMPGAQVQGETATLVVRGGSSDEQLTFMDGMHVMCPYTSPSGNSLARNSYSAHILNGFSLAAGGAALEFGNGLSAVLSLETKDRNSKDKFGASVSTTGFGANGNKAFRNGSVSADFNYQNLGLCNRLFPCRTDYAEPFIMRSVASQARFTPSARTVVKVYAQYDRTTFANNESTEPRVMSFTENNLYLNSTLRHTTAHEWQWFCGMAWSGNLQDITNASTVGDSYGTNRSEVHLKIKTCKLLSAKTRLDIGMESYLQHYRMSYKTTGVDYSTDVSPTVSAAYAGLRHEVVRHLTADIALRAEHTTPNDRPTLSPRLAVSYERGSLTVSASAGRYTLLPENSHIVNQPDLLSRVCVQRNIGVKYHGGRRTFFIEAYHKNYFHLPLNTGTDAYGRTLMNSTGSGRSRGFDLFFRDNASVSNLEVQLSYSFNKSERRWLDLAEMTTPQYATRHNAAIVLKYIALPIRSIISLTERFSSGRPWHNPSLAGLMNDTVKPYNSLNIGWTYLLSRRLVVHTALSNILCRKNVFGRDDTGFVRPSQDNFLYIGLIFSV